MDLVERVVALQHHDGHMELFAAARKHVLAVEQFLDVSLHLHGGRERARLVHAVARGGAHPQQNVSEGCRITLVTLSLTSDGLDRGGQEKSSVERHLRAYAATAGTHLDAQRRGVIRQLEGVGEVTGEPASLHLRISVPPLPLPGPILVEIGQAVPDGRGVLNAFQRLTRHERLSPAARRVMVEQSQPPQEVACSPVVVRRPENTGRRPIDLGRNPVPYDIGMVRPPEFGRLHGHMQLITAVRQHVQAVEQGLDSLLQRRGGRRRGVPGEDIGVDTHAQPHLDLANVAAIRTVLTRDLDHGGVEEGAVDLHIRTHPAVGGVKFEVHSGRRPIGLLYEGVGAHPLRPDRLLSRIERGQVVPDGRRLPEKESRHTPTATGASRRRTARHRSPRTDLGTRGEPDRRRGGIPPPFARSLHGPGVHRSPT